MDIRPDEVESVKTIGELNGQDVKLIKVYGGFNIAVGTKKKGKKKPEVLAAGSHPALVTYQLTKEFTDDFKPAMCKSEAEIMPSVEEKTIELTKNLTSCGFEAHILSKNNELNFIISRFGLNIVKYDAEVSSDQLYFKSRKLLKTITKQYPDISSNLAKIIDQKCQDLNIKSIKLED